MKCNGKFVFKSITKRPAGTMVGADGKEINYPSVYVLKADELSDNGEINERKFKIAENNSDLVNKLYQFEAYDKIELIFKVTIYTSRTILEVMDVEPYED